MELTDFTPCPYGILEIFIDLYPIHLVPPKMERNQAITLVFCAGEQYSVTFGCIEPLPTKTTEPPDVAAWVENKQRKLS